MTVEEFLVWQQGLEDRYELVAGMPVKMMTGASTAHDCIVVNVIMALGQQLRGSPCRPATAAVALRTKIRSVRRGDVVVICDPPRPDTFEANDLRLVVEVLSPSNKGLDWLRKLDE
jgi:Uma2 family endonuclease